MKHNYVLCASQEGFHQIVYSEWGEPNPEYPTVVCVHGLTRNRHDFDALAEFLSNQGRHVFCPDIVGRGDSSWFKNPHHYDFPQYVSDMTTLIARTIAPQIDWIGTSMGGLIGMMLAALPNSPIRCLILNDIGPQVPIHALWRLGKYAEKETTFTSQEQAKEYFKTIYADFGSLSEQQWEKFTEHSIQEKAPGLYVVKLDPNIKDAKSSMQLVKEFFHNPHKALEGILFDIDFWSVWKQVKCPVLVIRGNHSDFLLPEHVRKMQRIHPNVDVIEIEDAGHAPALLEQEHHEKITNWLINKKIKS